MDSKIKEELLNKIQQLQIKKEEENSPVMPFSITRAILEIPQAAKVDVQGDAVEISDAKTQAEPIVDFEHSTKKKEYSIYLGQYENKVTVHDMRQKGLDHEGKEMEIAKFDLVLTFKDGGEMMDFCKKLEDSGGYDRRKRNQS